MPDLRPVMDTAPEPRTAAVRRFNRFYTRRIGVLHEGLADTPFSLAESRLLWEFAHREQTTGAELARDLDLDPGYLSRLLRGLKEGKLIRGVRSKEDARHLHLSLTAAGRRAAGSSSRSSTRAPSASTPIATMSAPAARNASSDAGFVGSSIATRSPRKSCATSAMACCAPLVTMICAAVVGRPRSV